MTKPKTAAEIDVDAWFPFYINAFLGRTMKLTTLEIGAFCLLMMAYWKDGAPLEDDDATLATIAKLSLRDWRKMRAKIIELFNAEEGLLRLARMDKELVKAVANKQQKVEAGKASAEAKKAKKAAGAATGVGTDVDTNDTTGWVTARSTARPAAPATGEPAAGSAAAPRRPNPLPLPKPGDPSFGSLSDAGATDGRQMPIARDWTPDDDQWAMGEATTAAGIDPGVIPSEAERAAISAWVDLTILRFRDYWLAQGALRADWQAQWRNWVRTEINLGRGPVLPGPLPASPSGATVTAIDAARRLREATEAEMAGVLRPLFGDSRVYLVRHVSEADMAFHRWQLAERTAGRLERPTPVRPKTWVQPVVDGPAPEAVPVPKAEAPGEVVPPASGLTAAEDAALEIPVFLRRTAGGGA